MPILDIGGAVLQSVVLVLLRSGRIITGCTAGVNALQNDGSDRDRIQLQLGLVNSGYLHEMLQQANFKRATTMDWHRNSSGLSALA